jgi:hypothetical protein
MAFERKGPRRQKRRRRENRVEILTLRLGGGKGIEWNGKIRIF